MSANICNKLAADGGRRAHMHGCNVARMEENLFCIVVGLYGVAYAGMLARLVKYS